MKFSLLGFVALTCVIGVYCQTFGAYPYSYYPYYGYGQPRKTNYGWFIGAIVILALLFPNFFGPLGTGLQNFAGALTGNMNSNSTNGNGGGNVPPIIN